MWPVATAEERFSRFKSSSKPRGIVFNLSISAISILLSGSTRFPTNASVGLVTRERLRGIHLKHEQPNECVNVDDMTTLI